MLITQTFTTEEAKWVGEQIGIDWLKYDIEQFRMGLAVELEHGKINPVTNVTDDDLILTGKIALAHLNEISDYYSRLEKMETEAAAHLIKHKSDLIYAEDSDDIIL